MATVQTVVQAKLDDLSVEVSAITMERALLDLDLIGTDAYTKAKSEAVDHLLYVLLSDLLAMPDITDAGTSLRWDRNAIKTYLAKLAAKWGWGASVEVQPTITDRSNLW